MLTKHFDLFCNDDCLVGDKTIIIVVGVIRKYVIMLNRAVACPFNLLEVWGCVR